MSDIVFVKIRNDKGTIYDSYTDYWRLIELSGFTVCEMSEVDLGSTNYYIFSPVTGNVIEALGVYATRKCKIIGWQLERPENNENIIAKTNVLAHSFDAMFYSDRAFAQSYADPRCLYVPIGGHRLLGGGDLPKVYDFAVFAYLHGARLRLANQINDLGFSRAPNGWGEQRDADLARCRWGLCLHQDHLKIIEPLRYTLFACWKLPLIAEESFDFHPYKVASFSSLSKFRVTVASATDWETNYRLLTEELTFEHCVRRAVEGIK